MKRTYFLLILLLTSASLAKANDARPNVIFIMADDLGYGDLGAYGATQVSTPHCDRLANEGMLFTDAHSSSAVCTPTRYSVLTGRYAWRTWLKNWVIFEQYPLLIDTNRLTMGKLFQQRGYRSIAVGKWHLGWGTEFGRDFNGDVRPGPLEVGFDDFFGVPHSHNSIDSYRVYVRDRRIIGLKDGEQFDDPEVMKRTMRRYEDTAIDISNEAVAYIEKHKGEPFFMYYAATNIHFPVTPHERFQGKSNAGPYGDFIVEFDWAVGEILATLDRLNLADNTIVVVTSDNGARPMENMNGHLPNGNWRGTKRLIYEAGHRVPLIVRWPGQVQAGSSSSETVSLNDFFRTFAHMLEVSLPADAGEDSYDITPVLMGEGYESPLREATVHHSVNGTFAIRKGDWKLIEGPGDGDYEGDRSGRGRNLHYPGFPARDPDTGEFYPMEFAIRHLYPNQTPVLQLYNLKDDPREQVNLANRETEIANELLDLLNEYRQSDRSAPK